MKNSHAQLGNLYHRLALACNVCFWKPEKKVTMGVVAAHFATEHAIPQGDPTAELVLQPYCPNDHIMQVTHERPTGGGKKIYYACECSQGFILQGDIS
jgi:hypothetical protein